MRHYLKFSVITEEKEYEGEQEYTVGYNVRYSENIFILLKLIVEEYNINGKCPCCNKSIVLWRKKHEELRSSIYNNL